MRGGGLFILFHLYIYFSLFLFFIGVYNFILLYYIIYPSPLPLPPFLSDGEEVGSGKGEGIELIAHIYFFHLFFQRN